MSGIETIKEVVANSGYTYADIAKAIGYEGDHPTPYVGRKFSSRKNMDVDMAAQILEAVGYKLVIMPAGSKTPKDGTEIR